MQKLINNIKFEIRRVYYRLTDPQPDIDRPEAWKAWFIRTSKRSIMSAAAQLPIDYVYKE